MENQCEQEQESKRPHEIKIIESRNPPLPVLGGVRPDLAALDLRAWQQCLTASETVYAVGPRMPLLQ